MSTWDGLLLSWFGNKGFQCLIIITLMRCGDCRRIRSVNRMDVEKNMEKDRVSLCLKKVEKDACTGWCSCFDLFVDSNLSC